MGKENGDLVKSGWRVIFHSLRTDENYLLSFTFLLNE